jgi:hypothetical protein
MRNKFVLSFIFICVIFLSANAQMDNNYSRVRIKCNNVNELSEIGIGILGGSINKSGFFVGEITSSDTSKLSTAGFLYTVIINDISAFYTQRNNNNNNNAQVDQKNIVYNCGQHKEYITPVNFSLGSMGGFLTFDEAIEELDNMHTLFPELISQKNLIGTSIEGRSIYAVKISDNPGDDESADEKQALYTSIHHSQEPASLQQLIFFMYYLLENYETDSEIKFLVENLELYFVPVINPDGYVYNQSENPDGGGTWRKNRRPSLLFTGVDLNRNYDYAFGYNEIGSSSIGAHPWYRGTEAFSEPESLAMKNLIESQNFLIDLNWHSYGNYLIYPWNYESLLTQDSLLFEEYSRYITLESQYRYGTCDQTYGYNSNGDADDWGYGEIETKNKIISLTAEIGSSDDGFWPQVSDIIPLCKKSLDMNIRVARLAAKYALLSDISPTFLNALNGNISFETYCLGLDVPTNFSISLEPVSSQIISTGSDVQFDGMTTLERRNASIDYSLSPGTPQGTNLQFELNISNGVFTWVDTINKIYCIPDTLLKDNGSDLNNWNSSGFSMTSEQYASEPSCFTESANADYDLFQSSSLELISPLDLTDADYAYLSFKAIWEIEKSFDWAEVYASTDDGSTWTPLCGRYSSYGTDDQNLSEPVYDGFLNSWINEEMSLNNYIGNFVKLKFEFHSDQTNSFDGIYIDDILVLSYKNLNVGIQNYTPNKENYAFPNPSDGIIYLNLPEFDGKKIIVEIENVCGKTVYRRVFEHSVNPIMIDGNDIKNGSYFLKLSSENKRFKVQKIVFLR